MRGDRALEMEMDEAVLLFETVSSGYDEEEPRMFSRFGEELIRATAPGPRERILDLACGKGAITLPAALCNPEGETVGVDASRGMLEALQGRARRADLAVTTLLADVHKLPYTGQSFDRCYIGFSLFYFREPRQVLREVRRLLRPGGLVHLSSWEGSEGLVERELQRLLGTGYNAVRPLIRYRYGNLEECRNLLAQNGFCRGRAHEVTLSLSYRDPESWWRGLWNHGARRYLDALEPSVLRELKEALLPQLCERFGESGGVVMPVGAIFSTGER